MIRFRCEHCGQKFSVPQTSAGKKGRCPKCKNIIVIPAVTEPKSNVNKTASGAAEFSPKDALLNPNLFDIPQENKAAGHIAVQEDESDKAFDDLRKLQSGKIEPEPPPERKLPWLIDIFLYPANKPGLTMIGIFVGVPLLMELFVWLLFRAALSFPPFQVFAIFFLIINLLINIVILLYRYWYISEIVRDSAGGQIRAPETISNTPGGEIISSFLRIFICIVIFSAPIFYYLTKTRGVERNIVSLFWFLLLFSWIVVSEVGKSGMVFHLLLLFAIFFFPVTVLSVIMFDSLRGLNPILIIRSIFKTFVPYCGLVLLLSFLCVPIILLRKFIETEVMSGRSGFILILVGSVRIYLMLVAAHLLGRFYWKYEDRLDWEV